MYPLPDLLVISKVIRVDVCTPLPDLLVISKVIRVGVCTLSQTY